MEIRKSLQKVRVKEDQTSSRLEAPARTSFQEPQIEMESPLYELKKNIALCHQKQQEVLFVLKEITAILKS